MILRGGIWYGSRANTFRVVNDDTFTWNLLDDVWLGVKAPHVKVRQDGPYIGDGRHGWYSTSDAPRREPSPLAPLSRYDQMRVIRRLMILVLVRW